MAASVALDAESSADILKSHTAISWKVAFVSERSGNQEIYTMNVDGSEVTQLTHNPGIDRDPKWSPDGTKLVFQSTRDQKIRALYVMDADGGQPVRLANTEGGSGPAWSPNGQRIAFDSHAHLNQFSAIYLVDPEDGRVVRLTDERRHNHYPVWSPDGRRLAYQSRDLGEVGTDIFVMDADGSQPVNLTRNAATKDLYPSWSPDGRQLAFTRDRHIYVLDLEGGQLTAIGAGFYPSWSPDGRMLVFSVDEGRGHLVAVEIGSPQHKIYLTGPRDFSNYHAAVYGAMGVGLFVPGT